MRSRRNSEDNTVYKAREDAPRSKHAGMGKRRAFPRKKGYIVALILMALASIAFFLMMIVMDVLPSDLTIITCLFVVAMLLITCFLFSSRYKWKRILGIIVAVLFVCVISGITGFMGNTYAMFNKISVGNVDASGPHAKSVDVTEEPFNVYITGIDQWEEEEGLDLERSDVNMIVTVNPVTKKVLLTSIPRDSYVKLHTAQQMDKLTHTGIYGVNETLSTVEDWMGIDINYYVKMNFTAVRDVINAMGGVRVYSPVSFDSSLRDYHYEKGWNDLGGREALFFARERHAFEGQDAIRVENQQRLMEAIIKKMTSSTTLLLKYGDVMNAAGKNLTTNMSASDMQDLARMQITELADWDIESQKITGEYDMDYVASLSSKRKYSVYRPDTKSVMSCEEGIRKVINPTTSDVEEAASKRSKSFLVNYANYLKQKASEVKDKDG